MNSSFGYTFTTKGQISGRSSAMGNTRLNWVAVFVAALIAFAGGLVNVLGFSWEPNGFVIAPFGAVSLFVLFSLKIADQWERMVILRLGKFHRLAGPG
ncbi:MAG: hypothetical protein ACYTHM_21415, partial [Planctomycetota bacterium]